MKKRLIGFTAGLILLATSVFATSTNEPTSATITNFNKQFSHAKETRWENVSGLYKATFYLDGRYLTAFFEADGEMVNVSSNISSEALPVILRSILNEKLPGSWISELFEVDEQSSIVYFAVVENAFKKIIYKSENDEWYIYRSEDK